MKVFLVIQESVVNGEHLFGAIPCKDLETAQKVMNENARTILSESFFEDYVEGCDWAEMEQGDNYFSIVALYDDYSEFITIVPKDVV